MKTFFTSDTHFNHVNIITYSSRPYANIDEMNKALIDNWNSVVGVNDRIFHIGDFIMGDRSKIYDILPRLNGEITLIHGNHDLNSKGHVNNDIKAAFKHIYSERYELVDNEWVYMRHIPKMSFVPSPEASVHLCGHVHEAWVRSGPIENVGVDVCGYRPMTLAQLKAREQKHGRSHRDGFD